MGEAELVAGFAAGEPGSVAEVYRRYGRLVYAVSYRVLGEADLAADATQRTFVQASRLAGSSDPGLDLGPWLAGIAARTAGEAHERARRQSIPASAARDDPSSNVPAPSADQLHHVWRVRRALDALPAQDRELLRLQHDQRLTQREISDQLAIPIDRVRSRSHQAHRRIAALLGHVGADREAGTPSAAENQSGQTRSRS